MKEPEKLCALTFDDGPDTIKTNLILDILETHQLPASFFVIGQLVSSETETTLKRAVNAGCEIHNHSWSWDSMNTMTAREIQNSVEKTTRAIQNFAGVTPSFFRPPNLAVSDLMYESIEFPFAAGITGEDWDPQSTAQSISKRILDQVQDGSIILLHDVQSRSDHPTPEALEIIIPELKKRGYQMLALTELFIRKSVDPESKKFDWWNVVQ